MHMLVLGAGFSGCRIARTASRLGTVCGTRRSAAGLDELSRWGIPGILLDSKLSQDVTSQLAITTHLVVGVAPARNAPLDDPLLRLLNPLSRQQLPALEWIGYLSSIGVYGDHAGQWVDETTPCSSTQTRSIMRREAELAWEQFGAGLGVPVALLRLSGIYGPGRSAVNDALQGRARMLIKPGQVFNRVHVDDLAAAALKASQAFYAGILNITDDLPAAPQDVIAYAHDLVGRPAPEAHDFASADLSPMARSFYGENKRVNNQLGKSVLDFDYQYPTYKEGLNAVWAGINERFKT